jgi:hypothetical protein
VQNAIFADFGQEGLLVQNTYFWCRRDFWCKADFLCKHDFWCKARLNQNYPFRVDFGAKPLAD